MLRLGHPDRIRAHSTMEEASRSSSHASSSWESARATVVAAPTCRGEGASPSVLREGVLDKQSDWLGAFKHRFVQHLRCGKQGDV